jgi:hypothetical protein
MTEKMTKAVFDCATGTTEYIELNETEVAQVLAQNAAAEEFAIQREAELEARATAKASAEAKLAELGLTPEEIAALR